MNNIITFYSYKGGVGRTMSLVNVAVVMAGWGLKVLIVDWDLEAPGIPYFFKSDLDQESLKERSGVIDLLDGTVAPEEWRTSVHVISIPGVSANIDFISSGRRDENYFRKVRSFDMDRFYYETNGVAKLEKLREEWSDSYDFVLVDSRTGITEMGGMCTIQMPDIVVLLFTATEQGFEGTMEIARRASRGQQLLQYSRQKLVYLPIPSRLDPSEFILTEEWMDTFAKELNMIYMDWLPRSVKQKEFLKQTKIPYVPYFSFGEKLPVIEQGTSDPSGLGHAYETIAALLAGRLENIDVFINSREHYIRRTQQQLIAAGRTGERKVFISYNRSDQELMNVLSAYLRRQFAGISIISWDSLEPAKVILDKDVLLDINVIIYIFSDEYYESKTSMQELFFLQQVAEDSGGAIKEIRLKQMDEREVSELPMENQIQFLNTPDHKFLPITQALKNL